MNVYVNNITGIADSIVSMFMSKRTWTKELDDHIRYVCDIVVDHNGRFIETAEPHGYVEEFRDWMNKLTKWGRSHITMLRYIDFSINVEGLHRGGQDDFDSHAMRFNNRIIRSSTRLADFGYEMSDFYKGKILPTDQALKELGIAVPDVFTDDDGTTWVKTINGYIREDLQDNRDVQRGLYMLSIPSNFIVKVNLTEWAHVFKERNINSGANPEVKELVEAIADQLIEMQPWFNRTLFEDIKN